MGERVSFWARGEMKSGGSLWLEVLFCAGFGVFWGFRELWSVGGRGWARGGWGLESRLPLGGEAFRGLRGASSVGGELRPFGARVLGVSYSTGCAALHPWLGPGAPLGFGAGGFDFRGLRGVSPTGEELRPFGARVEAVRLPRVALRFTRGSVRAPLWGSDRGGSISAGCAEFPRVRSCAPLGLGSRRFDFHGLRCASPVAGYERPFGARMRAWLFWVWVPHPCGVGFFGWGGVLWGGRVCCD